MEADEVMEIIDTVNPGEIHSPRARLVTAVSCSQNTGAYGFTTQTIFQLITKTHTVCTVTNLTDLNIFPRITTYSWVGKFPRLYKAPVALKTQKTALVVHYHNDAGADAAAFVSCPLEDNRLSFMLAWDSPAAGPKRCYVEVIQVNEDDDEPDWEKLRHKVSLSPQSTTVVNKKLGYACKVGAQQLNTNRGTLIHVAATFSKTN